MKFIVLSTFLAAAAVAHADLIVTKHSSDFTYLYEMDVNPSGQDLDSNTTQDWFGGTAGGSTIPQDYTGGVARSDQNPASGDPQNLFRTDIGGSITRATLADANTPWTMELSARKTGGTQGVDGWFGVAMQNPGASFSTRVNFEDDRISYRTGGTYADYLVGTDFADGAFHTMRIAYEGSDNYFVWINDILLNSDLTSAGAFAGGNGSFNTGGSWFMGDFSGGIGGDWEVDYIRYEAGTAFAAVPEASELALFALGALSLALYRRK
ncbi:MAG: hypothetical protein HKN82_13190 [Akkermansiaceae bacterium]|nr:hypothetical protein [Akkermansiaceae bacterium]NNM31077.1 hypothetical protein [Akkermansiaceae bacterium]